MRIAATVLSLALAACSPAAVPATQPPGTSASATAVTPRVTAAPTIAASLAPTRPSELLSVRPVGFGGSPLGFLEHLPADFGTGGQKPLLVSLHSSGEVGNGTEEQLELVTAGIAEFIRNGSWPADLPFVVLMPQYSDDEDCALADEIDSFLDWAVPEYAVDPERVYLTGISCGAIGVWDYLAEHGDEVVSAAVPIGGQLEDAWPKAGCDLGRVPVWVFHGEEDEIVPVTVVRDRVEELGACSSPPPVEVRLEILPGADHVESLSLPYDLSTGADIYSWLLQH